MRLGELRVTVLLDVAEDNCRVGYRECEGYSILVESLFRGRGGLLGMQ